MSLKETSSELKKHIENTVMLVKTLRDEIRLDVHLAGMETRDEWKWLESRYAEVEVLAHRITDASKERLEELVAAFRRFQASLKTKARRSRDGAGKQPEAKA
jgi:hypothetical protein